MMKKSDSEKFAEPVERQRDIEMKKRIEDHNVGIFCFCNIVLESVSPCRNNEACYLCTNVS